MVAIEEIQNFEDDATWDLICSGRTKGVFQLESRLGSSWAKRSHPRSIEELADLVSIIRPGTLEAELDGKSMTKHYTDRKAQIDETKYLHPALEPILSSTYGIIVYQEQAMRIATEIAGFTPEEADSLRKAMGKKDSALMREVREKFITGTKNKGLVDDKSAEQIFDWIQASARYSFNKSHAVAYAINSYHSAYCKAHDPLKFYEVYLNHAEHKPDKQRELKELIMDAKLDNIEILPPRLDFFYRRFTMDRDKKIIYFGYSNVKNVGEGEQEKLAKVIEESVVQANKKLEEFTWLDSLFLIGHNIKKSAFISIVSVGGVNGKNNKKSRNEMIFEFNAWNSLTGKEQEWVLAHWNKNKDSVESFISLISDLINYNQKINVKRLKLVIDIYQSLQNPPYSLKDDLAWIADIEEKLMGCSLTCVKTDSLVIDDVNVTCRDIASGEIKKLQDARLGVKVNEVKEYKIKKGKSEGLVMGFMNVEDYSGELDSVTLFPEEYSEYKKLLFSGNTVLLLGEVQEKKDKSFVVKKVFQV